MPDQNAVKKFLFFAGFIVGGYAVYRLFRNTKTTSTLGSAVKKTIEDVIDVPAKAVEEVKEIATGSSETKKSAKKRKKRRLERGMSFQSVELAKNRVQHLAADGRKAYRKGHIVYEVIEEKEVAEFSKEKKEHPELPDTTIKKIVVDHEKKKSGASKGGEATAALGSHKGHKTKKGLGNDQKLQSQEVHEKQYRKKKSKKK